LCTRRVFCQVSDEVLVAIFWLLLVLTACNKNYEPVEPAETRVPTAEAEVVHQATVSAGITVIASPTVTSSPTPTSLPLPSPTATAIPEVLISAPPFLQRNVETALQNASSDRSIWQWAVADSELQGDIRLEPNDSGVAVGSRAIALTVPFTANWNDISASEAVQLISSEHADVMIMDWAVIPRDRKALHVDGLLPSDPSYPIRQEWSLVVTTNEYSQAALELAPYLRETIDADLLVHIAAVGDLMLDRAIGYALRAGDLSFPFDSVTEALQKADLTVGNLESSLGDIGRPVSKSYTFQAPPSAVDALSLAGFDLLSLANNHALDYGPDALLQAIRLLGQGGMATVGAGSNAASAHMPHIYEHDDLTVAFLSYVNVPVEVSGFDTRSWSATQSKPGLAWAEASQIHEDVTAARLDSDLVVVLLHSGYEYVEAPSPEQMAAAHAAADAGADLVLGHHAHVLQGVEFRGESVIVYGLGNFAFEIDGDPSTVILDVWLDSSGVRQIEFTPAIIEVGGRPRIATSWEAGEILHRLTYLSGLLNYQP
jgi:poly-gamma-glutamate synthesis protein (capsule biosynthesis protein)